MRGGGDRSSRGGRGALDARVDLFDAGRDARADEPDAAFDATPQLDAGSFAGSFEVPSGAISHNGEAYIFCSTRPGTDAIGPLRLSFIAHWPTAGSSPLSYQILYSIPRRHRRGDPRHR